MNDQIKLFALLSYIVGTSLCIAVTSDCVVSYGLDLTSAEDINRSVGSEDSVVVSSKEHVRQLLLYFG